MPEMTPELRARITAAKAACLDFSRETDNWIKDPTNEVPRPDFASWALRLAADLRGLIEQVEAK